MADRSLVIKVTAGKDDPERCNQAFTVAAAAVASGVRVSLWLTGESAWFGLPGRAEDFSLPHAAPLADLIETLFTIEAGAFSFEAANPRHEHAYHVFETVTLPPDTVLLPGVISHATNIVEHPEVIADRIVRFAERVGRENVVASADCGFSSQATYTPEIHPTIVWAKFEALAEGARLATARLWP